MFQTIKQNKRNPKIKVLANRKRTAQQKHFKESEIVSPQAGGRRGRAGAEVSSWLGAGALLTDFYSSPGSRWARRRHSLVLPVSPVSPHEEKQGTDCLHSGYWLSALNLWLEVGEFSEESMTCAGFVCFLQFVAQSGICGDAFVRERWATFCTSSCPLWEGTPSARCTCWRTHTFFTRGSAQPFTAHTSHTGEVRLRPGIWLLTSYWAAPSGDIRAQPF